MKFFLFIHLLFLWTCAIAYSQDVSYFSLLQKVLWVTWNFVFLFLKLLLLWTCAFTYAQVVSYFHYLITFIILTKSVVSDMKLVFFLHLLLLWTCAISYAQELSYFLVVQIFCHSDKRCSEWYEICFLSLVQSLMLSKLLFIHNFCHSDKKISNMKLFFSQWT